MKSCRTIPLKDRQEERDYQYEYYLGRNLVKTQDYQRRYYKKNRKKLLSSAKRWQKEHHNCILQYHKEWYKKNAQSQIDYHLIKYHGGTPKIKS